MRYVLELASVVWPKSLSATYIYNLDTIQYKLLKIIAYNMKNLFISRSSLISIQNVVNLDSLLWCQLINIIFDLFNYNITCPENLLKN